MYSSKREKAIDRAKNESGLGIDLGLAPTTKKQISFQSGTRVQIYTNAYMLEKAQKNIYQYEVKIEGAEFGPRILRTIVYRAICGEDAGPMSANNKWKEVIFDGRRMVYSTLSDLAAEKEFPPKSEKDQGFKVIIKSIKQIQYNSENAETLLQIFNVAFQNAYIKMGFERYMRKWIDERTKKTDGDFVFFEGFLPSIVNLSSGLAYVVDTTSRIGRTGTLYDIMKSCNGPRQRQEIENSIDDLELVTLCNKKNGKKRILEHPKLLWDKYASNESFEQNGKMITIAEYFYKSYNFQCKPDDFLVEVVKKRNDVVNRILFPSSTIAISGLSDFDRKKRGTMNVIGKNTRIDLEERKRRLDKFINRITTQTEAKEFLDRWGFKIGSAKQIQGRLIPPPALAFGGRDEQLQGELNYRLRENSLKLSPKFATNPLFIACENDRETMENLVRSFQKVSKGLQFPVMDIKPVYIRSSHENAYRSQIISEINRGNIPSYVLCLLPDDKKERYSGIKDMLTCKLGIPSQCVVKNTLAKNVDSVCTNLVAQIAAKSAGVVCRIADKSLKLKNTMVIGLSITQSKGHSPTIAAVSTYDRDLSQYYSECELQNQNQRTIDSDFCVRFLENALGAYKDANDDFPKRIVVYREGASYGQMRDIVKKEIEPIQQFLEEASPQTSFTFIVCQKHGSLRIMQQNGSSIKNCQPGTVVTDEISINGVAEFYLISHSARQGTATPTRYTILHNSSLDAWNDDHLITLTQYLTAIYPNWQGTIRIPAVLMLAGRLAEQKRTHLSDDINPRLNRFLHFL